MLREDRNRVFENAVALMESAKSIAEIGQYGHACSLLVLSLEEFSKYQVVLSNSGEDVVFNQEEVGRVFRNHKTKHKLLSEFQESLSAPSIEAFEKWVFQSASGQNSVHAEVEVNRFNSAGSFIATAFREFALPETDRIDFIVWLAQADDIKKKGLYVDLTLGKQSFPSELTIDDYQRALKFTVSIRNQTEVLRGLDITENEFMDWLNAGSLVHDS